MDIRGQLQTPPSPPGRGAAGDFRPAQHHSRAVGGIPRLAAALLALACFLTPARAVEPGEMLKDPALEARARKISQELRCLVCQNQSIDDSNAELARDLRLLVRERLAAGDSDAGVVAFVEARYGEFVLLRPRLSPHTILLWVAPLLLLSGIAIYLVQRTRKRADAVPQPAPLSPAEQERLEALLKKPLG